MKALQVKMLRDLRRMWLQAGAVALVLAAGIAVLMTTFGVWRALGSTRDAYYAEHRFAHVFATARRAPEALIGQIAAIDGVLAVEARASGMARIGLPGKALPAMAQLISLPDAGAPVLDIPAIVKGRLPAPQSHDEVALYAPFAEANGIGPGDTVSLTVNGRRLEARVSGLLLSPEFIYSVAPGSFLPDPARWGIVWMRKTAAAPLLDLEGAFNEVALLLAAGASEERVIHALDRLLAPWGGQEAHGRDRQTSHAFLSSELKGLRVSALLVPPILFAVAAFLVAMILGRLVALERPQIGLLKAIGYTRGEILRHYLFLAVVVAVLGTSLGWLSGWRLSWGLTQLYADFFHFPFVIFSLPLDVWAVSGLLAVAAAVTGAARAALEAARLPAAVAMAPPAPPAFRHGLLDRLLEGLDLSRLTMVALRNLVRWRWRSLGTLLGLAFSVAILLPTPHFEAGFDIIVEDSFYRTNRQDLTVQLVGERAPGVVLEMAALPGVLDAEGARSRPVELVNGHLKERVGLETIRPDARLARPLDMAGRPIRADRPGLWLSDWLAEKLALEPGDRFELRFLTGRRERVEVTLAGTVRQWFGVSAWAAPETFERLTREGPGVSAVHLRIDPAAETRLRQRLADMPAVQVTSSLADMRRQFDALVEENTRTMNVVNLAIALLIAFGVAYNQSRILFSERARELASLRILGFTSAEVSWVLLIETAILAALAMPVGWALGYGIVLGIDRQVSSDLYRMPQFISLDVFAYASFWVLVAVTATALAVHRRVDRLDLISALKMRE